MKSRKDLIMQKFTSLSTEDQKYALALIARFQSAIEERTGGQPINTRAVARRTMQRRPPADMAPGHRRHGVHR